MPETVQDTIDELRRVHHEIRQTELLILDLLAAPQLEIPLIMAALDTLNAANTSLAESLTNLGPAVTASNAAAVAVAEAEFQTAANATATNAAKLAAEVGNITGSGNATEPVTTALTITPGTVSIAAGFIGDTPIAITGGTGTLAASGLPAGVTFDGSANLVSDGTQVADATAVTVTISDSTTPTALQGTVAVTIS